MTILKFGFSTILLSGAALIATPALAEDQPLDDLVQVQLVEDIGASERVEAAALLRVLSQEAASAACHMAHDINPKESKELMLEAKGKFNLLLDALQYGNPTRNIIGGEERRKTIVQIEALREQWAPIYDAAATLLKDPHDKAALALIKAENESVLANASLLTSEIAGQYSNPAELLQSDVMLLDFAGRQEMLTQKMAKISCEIWAGNRDKDRIDLLTKTMGMYEMTMNALLNGMPAVGLLAAPNEEIETLLVKATEDWSVIKAELTMVMNDPDVSEAVRGTLYHDLNLAMYDMEKLEHLYVEHSKHDYNEEKTVKEGTLLD